MRARNYLLAGLVTVALFTFSACGRQSQPTYIEQNTEIKNDKSVYNQEVSLSQFEKREPNEKAKQNIQENTQPKETAKPASIYDKLDNKKIGWGLKRNGHLAPEIPQSYKDLLKKYNGFYIGDTSKKVVYLTFDEGYENGYTPKILDTLKSNGVKAAFFVTGPYIKEHPELVQRMIDEGHIVGNHTINHPSLPSITSDKLEQEIVGLDRMYNERWNKNMTFMRPPMGEFSDRTLAQLKDLGHRTVFWSFAYKDYDVNDQKGTDYAYKIIMDNLHNGEVMLLHAVSKDNANVLDKLIKDIKSQGYEIKNIDSI